METQKVRNKRKKSDSAAIPASISKKFKSAAAASSSDVVSPVPLSRKISGKLSRALLRSPPSPSSSDADVIAMAEAAAEMVAADAELSIGSQEGAEEEETEDGVLMELEQEEMLIGGSASGVLKPYPQGNELEYLEECFQLVALMVRGNAARLKDDLKQEGTRFYTWEGGDVKHGKRELSARLRLAERKVNARVRLTRESGNSLPRLEILAERLGLDAFEKKMITLLIGKLLTNFTLFFFCIIILRLSWSTLLSRHFLLLF